MLYRQIFYLFMTLLFPLSLMGCGEAVESNGQSVYFNEVNPDALQEEIDQGMSGLDKLMKRSSWLQREYPNPTISGHYLAGRFAASQDDMQAADKHMFKALSLDPDNAYLIQRTFPSSLGAGNIDNALSLAAKTGEGNLVIAHLGYSLLVADAIKKEDYLSAQQYLDALQTSSFGHYLKPITQGWIEAATGSPDQAIKIMKDQIQQYPSLKALYYMHMAMVSEYSGDHDKAIAYYNKSLGEHFSARTAWLLGSLYERMNRIDDAQSVYIELENNFPLTTFTSLALARLDKKDRSQAWRQATPADGIMSGFFDLASVLYQERSSRLALLYGQVALYLVPDDPFLQILMGDLFQEANNFDSAKKLYGSINPESDFFVISQTRIAKVFEEEGDIKEAIEILENLLDNSHVSDNILMNLGDLLRRNEEFEKSIPYYTQVIEGLKGGYMPEHWELFYARGISYEQSDQWAKAEADLKQALTLEPDQPYVLNYLGYSWADQGIHIDLALEYIKKAIELRPNDGYIIDSMGWVLYKLARYEEAVVFLEEAVAYLPGDPIINDHLGDAYWQVGRRVEAGFQWQRALDNAQDEELIAKIEGKLINGLTVSTAFVEGKPVAIKDLDNEPRDQTSH